MLSEENLPELLRQALQQKREEDEREDVIGTSCFCCLTSPHPASPSNPPSFFFLTPSAADLREVKPVWGPIARFACF